MYCAERYLIPWCKKAVANGFNKQMFLIVSAPIFGGTDDSVLEQYPIAVGANKLPMQISEMRQRLPTIYFQTQSVQNIDATTTATTHQKEATPDFLGQRSDAYLYKTKETMSEFVNPMSEDEIITNPNNNRHRRSTASKQNPLASLQENSSNVNDDSNKEDGKNTANMDDSLNLRFECHFLFFFLVSVFVAIFLLRIEV